MNNKTFIILENPEKGFSGKEFENFVKLASLEEARYLLKNKARFVQATWAFNTIVIQHCRCGHMELLQTPTNADNRRHWVSLLTKDGKRRRCSRCQCGDAYLGNTEEA